MAFQSQHVDPNVYKLDVNEIEVSLDFEQEATAATESVIFGEGSQNGSGKPKNQGIPHRKDDVTHVANFNYIGDDIRHESHGSHQGYRNPQLKEQENVAAARVPQVRRTRPRIQFGLTPKQLNELEDVFEKTKYPNEIISTVILDQSIVDEDADSREAYSYCSQIVGYNSSGTKEPFHRG
ncbi:putative rhox homeobox family member 1-like [Microtus ochrogaster]|uniref:Putative rhox homeobox family member 1-like n=1 Tax=Microtus ochrogaster TaxID=79684 RepID=A0A8J6KRP8_MICOH|nr:putative rhox homeobox family member 1-like [Microtus ochrogaster]